jgi:hypothetical protein
VTTKTELVSRLMRETGLSRSTVYRKLERGELTLESVSQPVSPQNPNKTAQIFKFPRLIGRRTETSVSREKTSPRRKASRRSWLAKFWPGPLAATLIVLGGGLGLATVATNFWYGLTSGPALTVNGVITACFGAICDAITIFGMLAAGAFWERRQRLASVVAFALALGAGSYSAITCASFSARTFEDAAAGRESVKKTAEMTEEQRQNGITIAKQKVVAATEDKERDCRRGRHFDRGECDKAAKAYLEATQTLATANGVQIVAAPAVSANDPGPSLLGQILHRVGGTEHRFKLIRMLIWTLAPVLAGALLFLVPMASRRKERP